MYEALRRLLPTLSALLLVACNESSGGSSAAPTPTVTNLGIPIHGGIGGGGLQVYNLSERDMGVDLNGDGDELDLVEHVFDVVRGSVVNTGIVAGSQNLGPDFVPVPLLAIGATVAIGVDELATGEADRNGDGDTFDSVLAVYERDTGLVTNLGLAVSNVIADEHLLAFDVLEFAQGQDLDLDGEVGATTRVPFVRDLATGETWNTGLDGRVLSLGDRSVALFEMERDVGDRNGDGDVDDFVCALYDVDTRSAQSTGLALSRGLFAGVDLPTVPVFRNGWAIRVSEAAQGETDLNGDGDAVDTILVFFDPRTGFRRSLGSLFTRFRPPSIAPLVLLETSDEPPFTSVVWLYDPLADRLESTGLAFGGFEVLGERLVVTVDERGQGEDLDGNGALDSFVPVLYDPASTRKENLGVDGILARPREGGLWFESRESASRRDWNGDGDLEDSVLQSWDERTGRLVNTRLATTGFVTIGRDSVLLLVPERDEARDRNGDGDTLDQVAAIHDLGTGRTTNLGIATPLLLGGEGGRSLLGAFEDEQGADLDGDGDLFDRVLFLVELR